jgi:hypothetical protein
MSRHSECCHIFALVVSGTLTVTIQVAALHALLYSCTDHPRLLCNLSKSEKASKYQLYEITLVPQTLYDLIQEELYFYAKRNLVLVNVYIKDPVVSRINSDQKIPVIDCVAKPGGLHGVCMWFSIMSVAVYARVA